MAFKLSYKPYGEQAILIEWPNKIQDHMLYDVLEFKTKIESGLSERVKEARSAYQSLLIVYEGKVNDFDTEVELLKSIYQTLNSSQKKKQSRLWKIPVCYSSEFAIDIENLAGPIRIPASEIIKLHTEPIYTVCFIGFLPGFLYLSGLNEILNSPRMAVPRLKVEKGALAIGGNQTGIYPQKSPGGWHVIGNSPIEFFNAEKTPPCFAKAGDQLKFYEVDVNRHQQITLEITNQTYSLESELVND